MVRRSIRGGQHRSRTMPNTHNMIAPKSLEGLLEDIQLSRADREAAIRQMRVADDVASAISRSIAFLRRLATAR
jgi:hypothetical protein